MFSEVILGQYRRIVTMSVWWVLVLPLGKWKITVVLECCNVYASLHFEKIGDTNISDRLLYTSLFSPDRKSVV